MHFGVQSFRRNSITYLPLSTNYALNRLYASGFEPVEIIIITNGQK